jgi:hypothetical protein
MSTEPAKSTPESLLPDETAISSDTFQAAVRRSEALWRDIPANPHKYRVLTGDRPTGSLHIGHLFGSLQNRVKIQNLGVTTFIVVADYQVLTDRETADNVAANVREIVLDYLAAGLDPENGRTLSSRTPTSRRSTSSCCPSSPSSRCPSSTATPR